VSDFLTEEEQLAKLKSWWQENGLMLLGSVVVVIAGVIGWRWYDDYRVEKIAVASDLYADFLAAEGVEKDTIAETIAAEIPGSVYYTLSVLASAQSSVEAEDFTTAEAQLGQALDSAGDSTLEDLVRIRLAKVLQQLDRSDEALQTLAGVRSEGFRPQVAEIKGDIHLLRGERALAHEAYSAALENLKDGVQKPLLQMKVFDTADANEA